MLKVRGAVKYRIRRLDSPLCTNEVLKKHFSFRGHPFRHSHICLPLHVSSYCGKSIADAGSQTSLDICICREQSSFLFVLQYNFMTIDLIVDFDEIVLGKVASIVDTSVI